MLENMNKIDIKLVNDVIDEKLGFVTEDTLLQVAAEYLNNEYRVNELFISKREDMENEIMLGLRKLEGIDIENFFNKYEVNIQDEFNVLPLLKNKLLMIIE